MLANPLLTEALDALRDDLNTQLMTVRLDDVEGQKRLVMALQMSGAVDKYLRTLIREGESAVGSLELRGRRID